MKKIGILAMLVVIIAGCKPYTDYPKTGGLEILKPQSDYAVYMLFGSPPALHSGLHWFMHEVPSIVWTNRPYQFNMKYVPTNIEMIDDPELHGIILNYGSTLGATLQSAYTPFEQRLDKLFKENPNATYTVYATDGFLWMVPYYFYRKGIAPEQITLEILNDGSEATALYREDPSLFDTHVTEVKKMIEIATLNPTLMTRWSSRYAFAAGFVMDGRFWFIDETEYVGTTIAETRLRFLNLPYRMLYESLPQSQRSDFEKSMFFDVAKMTKTLFPNNGKKAPIIIAGTYRSTPSGLVVSENFETEMQTLLDHFGSDYTYFFKGHPVLPEGNKTAREWMKKAGINIFPQDTRFPFEMLLLHYPDLIVGGYTTSSFLTASDKQFRFHIGELSGALKMRHQWGSWPNLFIIAGATTRSVFSMDAYHDFDAYYYDPYSKSYILYPDQA
ncbi:hypothetical protein PVA44_06530 [Entomospira nematocerorum]|uniref:Uncharacterized protein n=1 Tax=Entomospira nematocerorum TaxID=2719987 RepID=A0A968KTL9_9SPIO|nr:hypothetical protein [Entomospira nematocera]NIZ46324.1 hypothetical protein [Entomospira nematocera]WDI33872.1 hypothetical protein PVA44_06530 [Entomospira nematocera]